MNEFLFLTLVEKLLSLYNSDKIALASNSYTAEFKLLIGEMQDAVSQVE